MDDIGVIIYIVVGIIYFIFKVLGKKNKPQKRNSPQPTQQFDTAKEEQSPRRTRTFEDILRELAGEDAWEEEQIEKPQQNAKWENTKEDQSYLEELESQSNKYITIDEQVDLEDDSSLKSGLLKEVEEGEEVYSGFASSVAESLQDPDEVKKAIIMSEIINRKYS